MNNLERADDLAHWIKALRVALEELSAQDFGYELGTNEIREPSSQEWIIPERLKPLYVVCDGANMPDVHVGYFIDSAQRVASAIERGQPTRMEGPNVIDIHVFGSDGGGGLFALRIDDGSIYYLPTAGAVRDGVYYEDSIWTPLKLAGTLDEFLRLLNADVEAFVQNRPEHRYIVSPRDQHS
jgi:hypothetical protein